MFHTIWSQIGVVSNWGCCWEETFLLIFIKLKKKKCAKNIYSKVESLLSASGGRMGGGVSIYSSQEVMSRHKLLQLFGALNLHLVSIIRLIL